MTSAAMAFSLKNAASPSTNNSCDCSIADKFCDCGGNNRPVASTTIPGKVRRLHGGHSRKHLRPEKNYDRSAGGRNPAHLHTNVYTTSSNQPATTTTTAGGGKPGSGATPSRHISGGGGQQAPRERVTNGAAAIVDHHCNDLTETVLQGVRISCFLSGGEKRLCLPEVMSTALQHVPLIDIERACNRLKIHNQHCSPAQVYVLQLNKVLPPTTTTCGLITQANAERLCHYLLYTRRNRGKSSPLDIGALEDDSGSDVLSQLSSSKSAPGICLTAASQTDMKQTRVPVVHNCSGCVQGTAFVSLYKSPNSACIQCSQCCLLFSPPDFVCHGHRELVCQPETTSVGPHVCHWGLDSNKWRLYLNVDRKALCKTTEKECSQEGKQLVPRKANDQSLIDKLTIKSWEKQLGEFKKMFSDIYKGSGSAAINYGAHFNPNNLKTQLGQPFNVPNLLPAPPPSETKIRQHNATAYRDQAAPYSPLAATTMALTNPGAVAMEIGFDSLIRVAKQMSTNEEMVQNAMVEEIVKLRLICQHSTSFLFQTNSLLSHSVDQLARENFALKRDYEQLAEGCISKTTGGGTQSQCNCSKPTRRKLATLLPDPAEQTNAAAADPTDLSE